MAKFKIGQCIKVIKGKYRGIKADITRIESGSYLAGNSTATYRVYDDWIKKIKCPKLRNIK